MSETASATAHAAPLPRRPGTGLHAAGRRREPGRPVVLPRTPGDRVLLPGRPDPGLHDPGGRLHRGGRGPRQAGLDIIGVSPDEPDKLLTFREKESLGITLVSDPDKAMLKAYGAYGPKKLYGKEVVGVIRSTFIVDAEGRIESAAYNVKATGHVAKLRRELGLG